MQSSVRQPLSAHNSIERPSNEKSFTFIKPPKHQQLPLQDVEAFLHEIDRLQQENIKLKDYSSVPVKEQSVDQSKINQLLLENQNLQSQLEFYKQKVLIQEKSHNDAMKELDLKWKQDISTLKNALEQQDLKHRQNLRQEQLNSKQEINKLSSQIQQITSSDYKNSNMVNVLEQELVTLRKNNNILEEKLQQAIQSFDLQSKDQEFTLMKQQAIITSQESHLKEFKNKFQQIKEQNQEILQQNKQLKENNENKNVLELNLQNKLKMVESDFSHLQSTYGEHRQNLQSRIDELTQMYGSNQEQISKLQQQTNRDAETIKKLQQNLEYEISNRQNEVASIHKQKQQLISFLESELCQLKEQNQQLKNTNNKLDQQNKDQQKFWQKNFKDLENKTNVLGDECSRLNAIIRQRDEQISKYKKNLEEIGSQQNTILMDKDISQLQEIIQNRDEEINILKQQNDSLISDLSRQADNYRGLASQNKVLQKYAEEVKFNNITINELQSKCELMDKEIERLRARILEKSQQLEKVQKENVELQGKLKQKMR